MKYALAAVIAALTLVTAAAAVAEDSVSIWGNYYKERSTRVIEPIARVSKDLPFETEAEVTYLVDQISSASGAVTPLDEVFNEYRQEVRFGLTNEATMLRPGVNFRYSYEPDYRSLTFGASLGLALLDDTILIQGSVQGQSDDVRQRTRPGFVDELSTVLVGLSYSQILSRNWMFGFSGETQRLRGYQENTYRVENHPRERNRYAGAVWTAYQFSPTRTTGRLWYRFYTDSWELQGHSVELELTQQLGADLEIAPRVRLHTQGGVYFVSFRDGFLTTDPKLMPFDAQLYGVQVRWTQSWLAGTFLDAFSRSRIEPGYTYLDQHNFYGAAHIFQLGWYWPY